MVLAICSKHSCEKQPESLEKHECFEQNDGFSNLLEAFVWKTNRISRKTRMLRAEHASSRTMVLAICSKHSCEKQSESLEIVLLGTIFGFRFVLLGTIFGFSFVFWKPFSGLYTCGLRNHFRVYTCGLRNRFRVYICGFRDHFRVYTCGFRDEFRV